MADVKSLYYNGKFFKYNLTFKNIKKIYLKIDNEGNIKVSAPIFINLKDIEKFLYTNIEFIQKSILKNRDNIIFNLSTKIISIFGNMYKLIEIPSLKNYVKIDNETITIFYKKSEDIERQVKKTLKKYAISYFEKRVFEVASKIGMSYNDLKVKWLKTKWGYCDSNKIIVLNSKLICYKEEIIDYVIIHELCHTIHMNHSKEYWNLVEKYCPNWKKLRSELKK